MRVQIVDQTGLSMADSSVLRRARVRRRRRIAARVVVIVVRIQVENLVVVVVVIVFFGLLQVKEKWGRRRCHVQIVQRSTHGAHDLRRWIRCGHDHIVAKSNTFCDLIAVAQLVVTQITRIIIVVVVLIVIAQVGLDTGFVVG